MASPSVFSIEEQSGPGRRLELVGPGLPLRGPGWPTGQRLVTSWNQGNGNEATQHVLGSEDRESQFSGLWNTTRLTSFPCRLFASASSTGEPVVDAFTLYEIVDDMTRAGRLLRVTWSAGQGLGTRERTIVRLGRIAEFDQKFDRADDIGWTLRFEWIGRGEGSLPAAPARGESLRAAMASMSIALGDVATSLEAARIVSARASIPGSADVFTLGDLEQLAGAPARIVGDFARAARQIEAQADQAGALIEKVRTTPDALREQCFAIATNARGALSRFQQATGTMPAETLSSDDRRTAPALRATVFVNAAADGARKAGATSSNAARVSSRRGSAIEFDEKGRRVATGDVERTYVAKKGDTFASIAIRFYGDASRAGDLARANGFPGYQVSPPSGAALVVPTFDATFSPSAA